MDNDTSEMGDLARSMMATTTARYWEQVQSWIDAGFNRETCIQFLTSAIGERAATRVVDEAFNDRSEMYGDIDALR